MEPVVQLQAQVATDAYRWYEAVATLAQGSPNTTASALATLHQYLNDLQISAANAHLQGLAEICQYLTDYFTQLPTLEPNQRGQLCHEIEPWPKRVINYLYSPTDVTVCEQLLACLPKATDTLPQPQPLESLIQTLLQPVLDYEEERTQSVREEPRTAVVNTSPIVHPSNEVNFSTKTPVKTEVTIMNSYISSSRGEDTVTPQLADLTEQIIDQSDTLAQALKQLLTHEEEEEAFLEGIEQYTNTVQQFWELAEKMGLKGFQQVCTFINDNFFECSNLLTSERLERHELFGQWTQLAVDYLNSPAEGAAPLVEHLSKNNWLLPLSERQANTLLNQLVQEGTLSQLAEQEELTSTSAPQESIVNQTEETLSVPPQAEQDQNDTTETVVESETHLETETAPPSDKDLAVTATESEASVTDEFELPMALDDMPAEELLLSEDDFADVSIDDLTLPGPLDELSSEEIDFPADLEEITEENEEVRDEHLAPPLVEDEVVSTTTQETPLSEANLAIQATVISELLENEVTPLDKEIDYSEENNFSAQINIEQYELSESIDSVEQLESNDIATGDFAKSAEIADDTHIPSTSESESVATEPPSVIPDTPSILITPAVLDLLTAEITEAQNDLLAALNKFVTAKDDSPDLLGAVEQYNDNVQSIFEAAQQAALAGLQFICTFIHDNVFELSTHPHGIRQAAKSYLETWPRLVLTYLHDPLQGIQPLITHLSHPAWPLALDDSQAQALWSLLTHGKLAETKDTDSETKSLPITVVETETELFENLTDVEKEIKLFEEPIDSVQLEGEELDQESEEKLTAEEPQQPSITLETESAAESDTTLELDPDFTLAAPKTIKLIIEQLQETTATLAITLDSLITAANDSEALLNAVESYTENVQIIWDAAEMAGLLGLQDVCTFINDNVMALGVQEQTSRQNSQEVLSAWPALVTAYLQNPRSAIDELITHLQNNDWSIPLPSENATQLRQRLIPEPEPVDSQAVCLVEQEQPESEPIILAAPDIIEILIGQVTEANELLSPILAQLIDALDDSETLLGAVESYTEQVQVIWDAAEMAGLLGLQDVCTFINDNVIASGGQDQASRQKSREVLSAWPKWVIAYLQNPATQVAALVTHLQDPNWPAALDDEAAVQLQQRLIPSSQLTVSQPPEEEATPPEQLSELSFETEPKPTEIVLAAPDIVEILIGQVTEVADLLNSTLEQLVTATEGSETLLGAIESYSENVQAIWDAAEMAGLVGLQEICTFINDNVITLSSQEQASRQAGREALATWPSLVIAYLQNPTQATEALINHLQKGNWPVPLDKEAAAQLYQRLTAGTQSPLPATITATEHVIPSTTPIEEPIYLAAPEILEVVCSQITDVAEGLSAALEVCVSMENDNPALLEAIENYTNQVQAIWDAAEMAGLSGLQEVCTFVNDNLMAFSIQDQNQKVATQTYFIQWPAQVLAYLQSPSTGAAQLVAFMQESGWPTPLEATLATNLLNLLTKPTQAAVTDEAATMREEEAVAAVVASEEVDSVAEVTPLEVEESVDISLGSVEVLEILRTELESAKEDLTTALNQFITLAPTEPRLNELLENYTEQVQRLNAAAEIMGLEGLQTICTFVTNNMTALSTQEVAAKNQAKSRLEQWPDLVLAYLQSPTDHVVALVNHFREPQWAQPLDDEAAHNLLNQLMAGSTSEDEEEDATAYSRQTVANPEDVILTISEDVNRELLEAYLQETPQHAADFSATIQSITQNPDPTEISKAQRIAHTLKGSSNIIGIKGIANIAHHLEDTLEYLAKHQVAPPKELTNTMLEAADCLEIMVDALLGQDDAPPQAQQVLQSVLDWANRIDKGRLDAPPTPTRPAVSESAPAPTTTQAETKTETKPAKTSAAEATAGTPEQFLRVPTKTVDELMRLVGELSISVGQIQEKLKHVIQSTRTLTEQDLVLQKKTFELENLVDVRGVTGMENRYRRPMIDDEEDEDFDPLEFEEYNELHSVAHSFVESIADNRELAMTIRDDLAELETMFIHQERLNKEFQASIMTTRMVPVSTIISKLQRNVRQTCRMTGKQAELEVTGADILIDSDVLNNLADPLQHILRNAIDHGLENADERTLLGKSEVGHIQLSFYREGNNIIVSCQDDGQGLNYTNIRFTAIQRGLITENQELTEPELARLILMSGFSTKSGVTQVSGRGVGMDVVHTNIRQMKGTLDLVSETGKGTVILIKLPMTLVTVHVLLVRVGEDTFGIPSNSLEQALAPGSGEFHLVGDEITLKMGKNIYALKSLADLLNLSGDQEGIEGYESRPIILAREETGITAILIDELIDTHDLVMKSMGKYVTKVHGIAGATILGDGSLIPLLDLPELLRSPMQSAMSSYLAEPTSEAETALGSPAIPRIMVVDDSLSVRKSLSLLLEDAGFETLLAKDGLEAIEVMNQQRPHVMLVDMEMPRMNGLELTAHVRANQATQKLPIFMITSRTTEKHREQARVAGVNAYLTKPYQDTELLDLIDKALSGQV